MNMRKIQFNLMKPGGGQSAALSKQRALVYLALAITGVVLLGMGLPTLRLQRGLPIPGGDPAPPGDMTVPAGQLGSPIALPWLLQAAMALGIIVLLVALVTTLFRKSSIKRISLTAAALVVLFALFSQFPRLSPAQPETYPEELLATHVPSFEYATAPIGDPPGGLLYAVLGAVLLIMVALGAWLLYRAFRKPVESEDRLALEVEAAARAILGGEKVENAVVRCYLRMVGVVEEEKGIGREESVTPREFEDHLAKRGIPRPPVLRLTRLFEKARYGNHVLGGQDERDALDCLAAIQAACRKGREGAA